MSRKFWVSTLILGIIFNLIAGSAVAAVMISQGSERPDAFLQIEGPPGKGVVRHVQGFEYEFTPPGAPNPVLVDVSNGVSARFERWECSLELTYPMMMTSPQVIDNGKLKFYNSAIEVNLYNVDPEVTYCTDEDGNLILHYLSGEPVEFVLNEDGGFEFEIILKRPPPTNEVIFGMEKEGFRFLYQKGLHPDHPTWVEHDDGSYSYTTLEAVGSYAVYHESKKHNEYKAGKAFHIYRPRIEDADGNWTWGTLYIDEDKGKLIVTIPQDFLDSAVYPIRYASGTVLGNNSAGAVALATTGDRVIAVGGGYTASFATSEGNFIEAYTDKIGGGSDYWQGGVVQVSDDDLIDNGTTPSVTCGGSPAWTRGTFATKPSMSNQDYYIALFTDTPQDLYYDSGYGTDYVYDDSGTFSTWPDPLSWTSSTGNDYEFSLYLDYTEVVAGGAEQAIVTVIS